MSAPLVASVNPAVNEKDVVLGSQIVVTFDQQIDVATINESTFSLTGPGQTQIFTPEQMSAQSPDTLTGREYITGQFQFEQDSQGRTVVRFNPDKPLRKDTTYDVLLLGANSSLTADSIKNISGEAMLESYEWSFVTGGLNVVEPPLPAPLPDEISYIDGKEIIVIPRKVVGNDLATEIQIIFPEDIDPTSFSLQDLLVSVEAILGDPSVIIPPDLVTTARVDGRKIIITITGWPAE